MADSLQPQGQQDPDAIRKAILLRIFGAAAGGGQPAGVPPNAVLDPTQQSGAAPGASGAPPTAMVPATNAAKPVAKPLGAGAANNNSGNPEPGNAPPFPDEATWQKQNPGPPHTPYVAPSLKQRMLEGLFAGMQEFGRPGQGAATVRDYLSDIRKNQEAEANYPQTAAAEAHQRYMTAAQGAEAPLQLQNLQTQIAERQAAAKAKANPQAKTRLVKIADPTGQDPHGIPAQQNAATGEITDQEGQVIPNAKLWEAPKKEQRPFNLDEQEFEARQALRSAKTPEERAAAQARIEDIRASRQRPPEERPPKTSQLTPGQKAAESRKYEKALDDIETERRARESGTYVHPKSGELMSPMTNDELFDRKQRAEDEYKDALEAAGETGVRRFNYRTGKYEGGEEQPAGNKAAKPLNAASAGAKPNAKPAPAQHQVGDEVMYHGKRHKITAITGGKATLQPLE